MLLLNNKLRISCVNAKSMEVENLVGYSVVALACGQIHNEENVELKENRNRQKGRVDDKTDDAQGSGQDEPGGQQDDVEQTQADHQVDHGVSKTLAVDLNQPGVVRRGSLK